MPTITAATAPRATQQQCRGQQLTATGTHFFFPKSITIKMKAEKEKRGGGGVKRRRGGITCLCMNLISYSPTVMKYL